MIAADNDTGTYYRLDERLEVVECNRTESEAFRKDGGDTVATTRLGDFATVVTTFEGTDDGFDEEYGPYPFMTMVYREDHSECEAHQTWREAEARHRERVDELKALLERLRGEGASRLL